MQYSLPEVEAQTTVDTLRDMDGKASVNTQADRVEEVNGDKIGKTGCDRRITCSLRWLAKHWETCRLTLDDTFPGTVSVVVANTIAITITCVKTEALVKTDGDIDAALQAYTDVDTINELEPVALVHPKAYTFS